MESRQYSHCGCLNHTIMNDKKEVLEFWNLKSCGEDLFLKTLDKAGYEEQINHRYELEPFMGLSEIYSSYLESPGTKAYTINEAHDLFSDFENVSIETVLTHGDLLTSKAGQRHEGILLNIARIIWPRFIIKKLFGKYGLFMLITAEKN